MPWDAMSLFSSFLSHFQFSAHTKKEGWDSHAVDLIREF